MLADSSVPLGYSREEAASGPLTINAAVLRVANVSKRYQIYRRPEDRLKQSLMPRLEKLLPSRYRRGQGYFKEFWALKDVSFSLERGEALGILGRNGAGKSTLLEIIAGTLTPTSGTVFTHGKVAALLELGSGFLPEFTGRENVRMNASLLGFTSKQIDDRFDEIVAFADIGDFIDQPVKTYSTGMMLRVAFAVQTAVEPEILIVDEALAVGDARFQKKCFGRLAHLQKSGTTILLVTHDSGTVVQFCTRAMILDTGSIYASGEPHLICREYHKLLFGTPTQAIAANTPGGTSAPLTTPSEPSAEPTILGSESTHHLAMEPVDEPAERGHEVRYGTGEAQIVRVGLRDPDGAETAVIEAHTTCEAYFDAIFPKPVSGPVAYGFIISNARGVEVYGTKSAFYSSSLRPMSAGAEFQCLLKFVVRLVPGRYFLSVALAHDDEREKGQFLDYRFDALEFQVIGAVRTFSTSVVDLDATLSHLQLRRSGSPIPK